MPRCRRGPSAIWSPTRITGFSAVIGSWKIIAICGPISARRSFAGIVSRSRPANSTRPESTSTPRGSRPATARRVSDLPEPDSPTMPSCCPGSSPTLRGEQVGEPVAEEGQPQAGDDDGEAGNRRLLPLGGDELLAVQDHAAPL